MAAESLTPPPGFLTFVCCVLFMLFVYSMVLGIQEKRGRIKAQAENKPVTVDQPVKIENVTPARYVEVHIFEEFKRRSETFVTVELFNQQFNQITGRFNALDKQLSKQVATSEEYMHQRFHKLDNDLQDISLRAENQGEKTREQIADSNRAGEARVTKVHDRINDVLRVVSELSGAFNQSQKERAG